MINTKKEFDWMYRNMIADLPITGVEYLRTDFTKWWKQLCKEIDRQRKVEMALLKEKYKTK